MLSSRAFDELAARIGQAIEMSPAKDIERNVRTMLASGLARLDLVPRAEFEVQAQVLLRTREKLEALERRLAELEAQMGSGSVATAQTGAAATASAGIAGGAAESTASAGIAGVAAGSTASDVDPMGRVPGSDPNAPPAAAMPG